MTEEIEELNGEKLKEILGELSIKRPVFDSEDDFKFSLAWKIKETFKDSDIRLEKKFSLMEGEGKDKNNRIDIYIKIGDISIGIELKYYTAYLKVKALSEKEGETTLANQLAFDIKCYDAWKDVQRLESFIEAKYIERGFSIWLTNIKSLIECKRLKENSAYREFWICEGTKNSPEMKWRGASSGTIKGREESIELNGEYKIHWENYKKIDTNYIEKGQENSDFKYSIVEVRGLK
jgi:desulfoferrodoxin (superoxide reductase-like protein)